MPGSVWLLALGLVSKVSSAHRGRYKHILKKHGMFFWSRACTFLLDGGTGRVVNWSNLLFPAYYFWFVRSCEVQDSCKHINSPAPLDNTYSQVNVLLFHFALTLMERYLPGCKIHHLAFQNIPLWISLLLMSGFIEMEIMGTPAGRGRQANVLSPSTLAEMG